MKANLSALLVRLSLIVLFIGSVLNLTPPVLAQSINVNNRVLTILGTNGSDSLNILDSNDSIFATMSSPGSQAGRSVLKTDIDSIEVDLRQGNDTVEINDIDFDGRLRVQTGSGNDLVDMAGVNLNSLQVTEGPRYDLGIPYSNTEISLTGSNINDVFLQGYRASVTDSRFESSLVVCAAFQELQRIDGWYVFSLSDNEGRLTDRDLNQILCNQLYVYCLNTDRFNFDDTVKLSAIATWTLDVSLDTGFDDVIVSGSQIMGQTRISMADSADGDYVYLNNLSTQGNVEVRTGNAADSVYVVQCEIDGYTSLSTGKGNDYSLFYNTDLGQLSADLGDHTDRIRISSTNILQAQLNGGPGADTLDIRNRANIQQLNHQGFETVLR